MRTRLKSKKAVTLLLAVIMMVAVVGGALAVSEWVLGDVNRDGKVDEADALLTLQHVTADATLEPEQLSLADVNGDSGVDYEDALQTMREAAAALKATIAATEVGETFEAGGRQWRVLAKDVGATGKGSGTDVLVISEDIMYYGTDATVTAAYGANATKWNLTNTTTGGYGASNIRNTVNAIYKNELQWAHAYAVQPVRTDTAWTANTSDTISITKSTGVKVGPGGDDGAFLLTYADVFTVGYFADNTARIAKYVGTAWNWWLRSPINTTGARSVNTDGTSNYGTASNAYGVRPALLLNLDS